MQPSLLTHLPPNPQLRLRYWPSRHQQGVCSLTPLWCLLLCGPRWWKGEGTNIFTQLRVQVQPSLVATASPIHALWGGSRKWHRPVHYVLECKTCGNASPGRILCGKYSYCPHMHTPWPLAAGWTLARHSSLDASHSHWPPGNWQVCHTKLSSPLHRISSSLTPPFHISPFSFWGSASLLPTTLLVLPAGSPQVLRASCLKWWQQWQGELLETEDTKLPLFWCSFIS